MTDDKNRGAVVSAPTMSVLPGVRRKLGTTIASIGGTAVEIERSGGDLLSVKTLKGKAVSVRIYPCMDCGHEVVSGETSCPHCGAATFAT